MKLIKKFNFLLIMAFIINIFIFMFANLSLKADAASYNPNLTLTGKNVYLYNQESNLGVFEQNADEKFDPIGITQVVTAILAIEKTDIDTEKATAKAFIFDDLFGFDFPTADVRRGETLTIRELLACMQLQCSYEAAAIIADYISDGSYAYFAEMMNKKIKEIGCENTNFVNPFGKPDANQYTTAKDMVKIFKYAMSLPTFAEMSLKNRYTIEANNVHDQSRLLVATNKMIDPSASSEYYYDKCIGGKTAGLMSTGRNGVFAATFNGLTYYCAVGLSPVRDDNGEYISKNGVITDAKALFKWAFNSFEVKNLLDEESPCGQVKLNLSSKKDFILVYPQDKFTSLVFKEVNETSVLLEKELPESVDAPIKVGQVIGKAKIILAGEIIGEIPLIAKEEIDYNVVLFVGKIVKDIFSSPWTIIISIILCLAIISYIVYAIIQNKNKKVRKPYKSIGMFRKKK